MAKISTNNPFERFFVWIEKNPILFITLVVGILIFVFFILPGLITKVSTLISFDQNTGVIGDTIGGITGPIVGLLVGILTFFAFWIQYRANETQKDDLAKERFENKFFELLRLHKENVNEMSITGYVRSLSTEISYEGTTPTNPKTITTKIERIITGRKIFVTCLAEFKACFKICEATLSNVYIEDKTRYLHRLAYLFFYNGVYDNTFTSSNDSVNTDKKNIEECRRHLKKASLQHFDSHGLENSYMHPLSKNAIKMKIKYKPFSGHISRFSHYYRHLYHIAKFIDKQKNEIISLEEKREYFKILRGQLSDHEQLMLYFNYLAGFGERWEDNSHQYFSTYRMIHNIPVAFTDFTINPGTEFSAQINKIRNNENEEMLAAYE